MTVNTSIPPKEQKSEQRVVEFFDNYFTKPIEVSANDYDAVISFFSKRDFDQTSAASVGQALLTQAKLEVTKRPCIYINLYGRIQTFINETRLITILNHLLFYNLSIMI